MPPKKVLLAVPPGLLEQVDFIATCEHRTRSDLFREALRRYVQGFKKENPYKTMPVPAEVEIIEHTTSPDGFVSVASPSLSIPSEQYLREQKDRELYERIHGIS